MLKAIFQVNGERTEGKQIYPAEGETLGPAEVAEIMTQRGVHVTRGISRIQIMPLRNERVKHYFPLMESPDLIDKVEIVAAQLFPKEDVIAIFDAFGIG